MNKNKKALNLAFLLLFSCLFLFRLNADTATGKSPAPSVFHNIGWNLLNSITYNYGFNFVGSGLATYGMIETGLDWRWRNFIYDNERVFAKLGGPTMGVGAIVPIITPLTFYIAGRSSDDEKLLIAASALTQTLILTMAVQSPLKMITGRRDPGLIDNRLYKRIDGEADFSGVFNWFNMDFINGWPSGHTANAFSAAATLSEIYHDNIRVKAAAFSYAVLMGLGVTIHAHWASDAVAGALIGYAIGKTVGRSYRKFLDGGGEKNTPSFFFTGHSAGIIIRL